MRAHLYARTLPTILCIHTTHDARIHAGGISLTVFGTNLYGTWHQWLGPASKNLQCTVQSSSHTQFRCNIPEGAGRMLALNLVNGGQQADQILYFNYSTFRSLASCATSCPASLPGVS